MICLTGIPGTGKTTICKMLDEKGIRCVSADSIAEQLECKEGDEVDIDCLRSKMIPSDIVVESHYSHLLKCDFIIILEAPESIIEERLAKRGYSEVKIRGNIDTQLSGSIYSEALDNLPATRIVRIDCSGKDINEVFTGVLSEMIVFNKTKS